MMSELPFCKLSDEEVADLAKSGSEEAYNHIIARYRNFVYSKAQNYYISGGEKEDLVQEGMIGLYKAVRDFDPSKSSFKTFAKLCVSRQMLTAVKNSSRDKHKPLNTYVSIDGGRDDSEVGFFDIPDEKHSVNPENVVIDRENVSGIECLINRTLSKLELKVLALYIDGLSYQDIAKKIDREPKTVDNAIQRIRKKIGKLLGE